MKPEQLAALVEYRLEQAEDTLREAEILLRESALRGVINRAYYAMFYSVLALLATRKIGASNRETAEETLEGAKSFVQEVKAHLQTIDLSPDNAK